MSHSEYCSAIRELDQQLEALMQKRAELTKYYSGEGESEPWMQFTPVDEIKRRGVRVVFQGVEGAYSHQAMLQFFGREVDSFKVPTFEQAMQAVEKGEADYAVLPLENTTGGAVGDVLDLQMKYHCYSVAMVDIPIQHVLLGLPGAKLSEITTVYSHPQGLAQCIDFMENYPEWERIPASNTAASAKKVMEDGDLTHAAIASELAGELYGLVPLAKQIATNRYNTTRFIVVTARKVYQKDADKVCICFECRHVKGILYRLLSHIIYNNLNMTKIESRPVPEHNFEYRFFVDIEGNLQDSNMQSALRAIRKEAKVCRILGNVIEP